MSQKILNTRIQLLGDLEATWASLNPVLKANEAALSWTSGNATDGYVGLVGIKFGNGVTAWNDLEYFGGEEAHTFSDISLLDEETGRKLEHIPAITKRLTSLGLTVADLPAGDVAIIKEEIANGKYSYTAYVTEEVNGVMTWKPMDGNYSAANVFTSEKITLSGNYSTIGNYSKNKVIEAGTSLQSILSGLFQTTLQPSVTQPTASISISSVTAKEVGETYTPPTATLTTQVGSYTYGPATGVKYLAGNVRLVEGAEPGTLGDTKPTGVAYKENSKDMVGGNTITLTASEYADSTTVYFTDAGQTYTFSGIAKNEASTASAIDNLGQPSNPEKKVSANVVTVSDQSTTIKGGRYCFYGICNNSLSQSNASNAQFKCESFDLSTIESADIRGLKKTSLNGDCPTTLNVPLSSTQVLFAVPAGKYKSLLVKDGNAQDATVSFDKKTGVKVEGAVSKIGDASTAIDYDVWYVTWADPIASAKALKLTWTK